MPFKEGDPSWDWENPDSLLDYPLTYEQLQIITKAVCESLTERFPGLFTECKGDQTVELARNIFVAFSEPLESEDDKSNADKDDLTELKREVAKLNSKILPVKLQADMQETLRAISAKLGELDAKISELGRAKIDGAENSKGETAEKVLYVSISQEEVDEASKRSEELERKAAEAEKAQQELEGNVESLQKEQAAKAQRRLADIKALETKIESNEHQKGDTDSLDTLKSANERAAKEESEKLENLRESGRKASVAVKQYRAEADKANVAAAQLKAKKINRLKFDLSWGYPSADNQVSIHLAFSFAVSCGPLTQNSNYAYAAARTFSMRRAFFFQETVANGPLLLWWTTTTETLMESSILAIIKAKPVAHIPSILHWTTCQRK